MSVILIVFIMMITVSGGQEPEQSNVWSQEIEIISPEPPTVSSLWNFYLRGVYQEKPIIDGILYWHRDRLKEYVSALFSQVNERIEYFQKNPEQLLLPSFVEFHHLLNTAVFLTSDMEASCSDFVENRNKALEIYLEEGNESLLRGAIESNSIEFLSALSDLFSCYGLHAGHTKEKSEVVILNSRGSASFDGAKFKDVVFEDVEMDGVNFLGSIMDNVTFRRVNCSVCHFYKSVFGDVRFDDAQFDYSIWTDGSECNAKNFD
jgi:hypothetical protein